MFVFGKIGREILHEKEARFGGADCGCAEAGGAGRACGGGDSQGGISEETFYNGRSSMLVWRPIRPGKRKHCRKRTAG